MSNRKNGSVREKLHEIIFESDTPAGKIFDIALLLLIVASVLTVMVESIEAIHSRAPRFFLIAEWGFTVIFTIEYFLRLYCVYRPMKYARSFFGMVDLLSILPTYLELLIQGTHYLMVIRALRLLRIFRIFKMGHFLTAGNTIVRALKASRRKITVFLSAILLIVIIIGSVMYMVEGGQNESFSNIPRSIYWAIVTLTTVGYGDITPVTGIGQFLSALVMILGYAIIAVPTGIVSAEFISERNMESSNQACRFCSREGHTSDAVYCKFCGEKLNE